MTKKQQNNHPETGYLTEIKIMISGLLVISGVISFNINGGQYMEQNDRLGKNPYFFQGKQLLNTKLLHEFNANKLN